MSDKLVPESLVPESQGSEEHYDIIVVGAGLVGAACAARLATGFGGDQLRIAVIEGRKFSPLQGNGFDPRVVALTEASRTLLDEMGVWAQVQNARVCPYYGMDVWDAEGTGRIEFDCADVRAPTLGHIVENSLLQGALQQRLMQLDNVALLCPETVDSLSRLPDQQVQLGLQSGRCISADLIVAADGAMSPIRTLAEMPVREWNYGHHAIVTTITTERSHDYIARQRFMATGPLAFLPLQTQSGYSHHCSIVWSQNEAEAKRLMALDDEAFCRALTQAGEGCLGEVKAVDRRFSFPLRQRHAIDYVKPGLALVGDAAHTIHPLAGQGVNLGFQDVTVLAEEVLRAVQRGLSPGDALSLGRYQRRRKPDNLRMMALMEGFKRLFEQDALPVRLLRNVGMSQLNHIQPLKNQLIREAMGL